MGELLNAHHERADTAKVGDRPIGKYGLMRHKKRHKDSRYNENRNESATFTCGYVFECVF